MKFGLIIFVLLFLQIASEAQDTVDNTIDTLRYPKHSQLFTIRLKGDSMVKSIYGEKFFNKHIRWSFNDSYYFSIYSLDGGVPYKWPRVDTNTTIRRTEFSIRYDIYYNSGNMKSAIQILMDNAGNLLPNHRWYNDKIYNQGFEKLDTSGLDIKIKKNDALELAKKYGLRKNDSNRVSCEFVWQQINDSASKIYNGNFYFEVVYAPKFTKRKKIRFQRGDKFKAYSYYWFFNPWTGAFAKKYTLSYYVNAYNLF